MALAIAVAVAVLVFLIARERRIYKANKAFRATAVQVVAPPLPRWWQVLLSNMIFVALLVAMVLALLRVVPTEDTTPGPSMPLDGGATNSPAPAGTAGAHVSSSASSSFSAPKGASR